MKAKNYFVAHNFPRFLYSHLTVLQHTRIRVARGLSTLDGLGCERHRAFHIDDKRGYPCLLTIQHIVRTYDSRQSCLWSAEQGDQMKIMRHTKPLSTYLTSSTFQSAAADGGRSTSHRKRKNKVKIPQETDKSKQVAVKSVH